MKRLASLAALALSAVVVAGCSDSTGATGTDYTLVALDGHPVPVSFSYIDGSTTVESGTLHLDSDGYAIRILRISESGMITRPEHAEVTYNRALIEPSEFRLIPLSCDVCAVEAIGQISGPTITLTLTHPANAAVYTYQLTSSM
jgi:hypothetical protein